MHTGGAGFRLACFSSSSQFFVALILSLTAGNEVRLRNWLLQLPYR